MGDVKMVLHQAHLGSALLFLSDSSARSSDSFSQTRCGCKRNWCGGCLTVQCSRMAAPAPLRVRVCRKGADPTTGAVVIEIDLSVFPPFGKGSTGWGTDVTALLKEAAQVRDIGSLGVWYAAYGEVEELLQNRSGWGTVTSMDSANVIVVDGIRVDEDSVYELPDEEQNSKRLYDLYIGGRCVVRKALQEVSCMPKLMQALDLSTNSSDSLSWLVAGYGPAPQLLQMCNDYDYDPFLSCSLSAKQTHRRRRCHARTQLVKELWGTRYGSHFPWKDDLALYRRKKIDRDKKSTIVAEESRLMGILILDGDWENVA
jgi:hypothetical protein